MTSDNISKPNLLVLGTQVTHKMCQNVKVKVRALLPYEPCCFFSAADVQKAAKLMLIPSLTTFHCSYPFVLPFTRRLLQMLPYRSWMACSSVLSMLMANEIRWEVSWVRGKLAGPPSPQTTWGLRQKHNFGWIAGIQAFDHGCCSFMRFSLVKFLYFVG